jgi:predicted O-methyltransferase YrrM
MPASLSSQLEPMNDLSNLREPVAVSSIWASSRKSGLTMASEPLTCSLLRTLAATKPGGRFLELGSGTGLSTAWILDGMDATACLTTVDNDKELLKILIEHLGDDRRLRAACSDGDEFLLSLIGQKFDFIFADTWSGKYRMLEECLSLLAPAGLYIIDDMLPQPNWPDGHAAKVYSLIKTLESREDLQITKLSWASGVIVCTRRASSAA